MPLIQNKVTVAAATTNDNLLSGSQFEYLPYDAYIEIGLCGDTNADDDVYIDVYSGQDVLLENGRLNGQNRTPIYPDDFTLVDVAAAGERLKIRARNTHASNNDVVFYSVRITPL